MKKLKLKCSTVNIKNQFLYPSYDIPPDSSNNGINGDNQANEYFRSSRSQLHKEPVRKETESLTRNKIRNPKISRKSKNDWTRTLKTIRLPVIPIQRLDLTVQTIPIVKGSFPKDCSRINTLPLPPTFDTDHLDVGNDLEIIEDLAHPDNEEFEVSLENYPNDNYLVGVTDSNAWVHKSVESQAIHTQLSAPNILESHEMVENNVYEILDSSTSTIECMNESSDDEEDFGLEWKQKESGPKKLNDFRQYIYFNPLLNLDGLKS